MWIAALSAALAGCPDSGPPECVTVDTACTPLYEPTFANVYSGTLQMGCGSQLSACHGPAGLGKMSLVDPSTAHASLLDGRVAPGDPGCSEIIVRTGAPGKDYQMPPGVNLGAADRCSLILWIQNGAPGPTATAAGAAP